MNIHSLSLRMRVYFLAGFAFVSLVSLVTIFYTSGQFVSRLQREEQEYAERAREAEEAKSILLQLNLLATEYLSGRSEEPGVRFGNLSEEFLYIVENVDALRARPSDSEFSNNAKSLVRDYNYSFIVRQRLGLTQDEGLEGELREAVHTVEEKLFARGDNELAVKMLMMRRHEKDFMMRLDPVYLKRHGERVEEFLQIVDERPFSETERTELEQLVLSYQADFNIWAETRIQLADATRRTENQFNALILHITTYADASLAEAQFFTQRQEETLRKLEAITLILAAVFSAISCLGTWRIGNSITKPLRRIARRMLSLCEQRSDGNKHFSRESQNEIEHLENVLGFMSESLAETDRLHEEVKFHRDNLQTEVAKRTLELREQALKLEQALGQEKELNELQNQFVSVVSHEFRTPLTIVDAMARRVAKCSADMSDDEIAQRMENIRHSVKRLSEMVERTLDSSRIANNNMRFCPEQFDFAKLVKDVVERHQEIAPDFQFEMRVKNVPESFSGDEHLLDHVVSNLVSNAIKYSKERPHVIVTLNGEADEVELKVRDHGVGIPKDELPMIAKRFFRASTSTGIKGTGIGLNLVANLVAMHSGEFSIDSEEGAWTEVTICLPVRGQPISPIEEKALPIPAA